jgi:hypothetical protein
MTSVIYQCTSVSSFWLATSSTYTTPLHISWFLAYAQYAPHPPHTVTHHEILFRIQNICCLSLRSLWCFVWNVKKNIYKRCTKIFPVVEYKYIISSVIWSQLMTKYCNMFNDVKKACQTKGTEDPRILDVLCLRAANPSMHLHVCAHAPRCWSSHVTIFKCLAREVDYRWLTVWCWENWTTTKVFMRNMRSDGKPFI